MLSLRLETQQQEVRPTVTERYRLSRKLFQIKSMAGRDKTAVGIAVNTVKHDKGFPKDTVSVINAINDTQAQVAKATYLKFLLGNQDTGILPVGLSEDIVVCFKFEGTHSHGMSALVTAKAHYAADTKKLLTVNVECQPGYEAYYKARIPITLPK